MSKQTSTTKAESMDVERLPFLRNGTLPQEAAAALEDRIERSDELQQIDRFDAHIAEALEHDPVAKVTEEDIQRIQQRAAMLVRPATEPKHSQSSAVGWLDWLTGSFAVPRLAVAGLVAVVGVQATLLFWSGSGNSPSTEQPVYRGAAQPVLMGELLRVVPADTVSVLALTDLLRKESVAIVSGPDESGAYLIRVPETANEQIVMQRLQETGVMISIERVQ